MLPMSPQQQFELAKEIAISNPERLKAVLRGTPDPIFKDLSIAMMALQGAEEERRAWEGMQAAQQTKQPSLREAMAAEMDREDAELGGVANLQAPNMDIPGGGVAGEEEPPVVQAAGGGMIKRFNGETGSEVPESTLGKWWREFTDPRKVDAIGSPAAIDPRVRELLNERRKLTVPFYEAVTPSERSRRERGVEEIDAQIRALRKAPDSSAVSPRYAPGTGAETADPGFVPAGASPSPAIIAAMKGSPRGTPRGVPAAPAAPAAAASPGIAALAASPDAVADMVDYRGENLPGAEAGAATGLGAYDPATIRAQIRAARARNLEEAKAATAPQWEALQKMWSKDEANREEKLSGLEREKRGVAALEAAMRLGQSGKTGMAALSEAFGAAGGVGARYGAERRKMETAFAAATEKRASASLAYEQGNFALATKLADQEQNHVDTAAKLAYDVEYKQALKGLKEREMTETERHNRANERAKAAENAWKANYYSGLAGREKRANTNAERQLVLGQAQIIRQQLADLSLPMDDRKRLTAELNNLMAQLQSLSSTAAAVKAPPPSDFSDKLPSGSRVVGSLVP